MRLVRARVQNFRSIEDSGEFEIGQLTCLVGKNEAGKTNLLNAIKGARPLKAFDFEKVTDYPRRYAARFDERHPDKKAEVVATWWEISDEDAKAFEEAFGPGTLLSRELTITYGFGYEAREWQVRVDGEKCLAHLISKHALNATERNALHSAKGGVEALAALENVAARTPKQEALRADIAKWRRNDEELAAIDFLSARTPKFFFTSHFERMSGEVSIEKLLADRAASKLSPGDQIFLDFLEYSGTSLEELQGAQQREALKARCEAAGNDITEEIFQFWSQNSALEVVIDFDSAKPGDPPPFNTGAIGQIRIRNNNHKATLPLSERSAGFVWFFSFLAQFKQLKKSAGKAIILLDEPGLTLHGKAQGDLLRYISERLLPEHQVIFTTHSPFMVPPDRLADVRVVEDVVLRQDGKTVVKGTKVRSDVLEVDDDTLFPLQGALGYEITQSLFIGKNTLLLEGPSDIVYLQVFSQALLRRGRTGLDKAWSLCPSGGVDKIAPFVRLFGGNKLNVAVLSDLAKGDVGKVEKLRKSDILKAGQFYTVADFIEQGEADIEDLLGPELFAETLNLAYSVSAANLITAESLLASAPETPRLVKKAEALFRLMPSSISEFGHFGAAEWLMRHPEFLDAQTPQKDAAFDRFERIFQTFNPLRQ